MGNSYTVDVNLLNAGHDVWI